MASLASLDTRTVDFAFQARWTEQNQILKRSLVEKTVRTYAWVLPFLLFIQGRRYAAVGAAVLLGLKAIVGHIVFPAQLESLGKAARKQGERLRSAYETGTTNVRDFYQVKTPDGVLLDVIHTKKGRQEPGRPIALVFQPNAATECSSLEWSNFCDTISFSYRGSGHSAGWADSARDLILDGDSVFQFALDHLGIPPDRLFVYGWSLGGGIAANVAALHPEFSGKVILDRTFSSTAMFARRVAWIFGEYFIRMIGWNIDTLAAVQTMDPSRICVATHPQDQVIIPAARLPSGSCHPVELQGQENPHCTPWNWFPQRQRVLDFIGGLSRVS